MSNKLKVLVDVDLTLVDSKKHWLDWYFNLTGHDISNEISKDSHNIEELMHNHYDPYAFWKKPNLYDDMIPFTSSVEVLTYLHNRGCEIIFCSACFPEHENSKKMFLQRNYKFPFKFVSTKDKGAVRCDYAIDDYKKYLDDIQEGNPDAKMFHIKTDINSEGKYEYVDWYDIKKIIAKDLDVLIDTQVEEITC